MAGYYQTHYYYFFHYPPIVVIIFTFCSASNGMELLHVVMHPNHYCSHCIYPVAPFHNWTMQYLSSFTLVSPLMFFTFHIYLSSFHVFYKAALESHAIILAFPSRLVSSTWSLLWFLFFFFISINFIECHFDVRFCLGKGWQPMRWLWSNIKTSS